MVRFQRWYETALGAASAVSAAMWRTIPAAKAPACTDSRPGRKASNVTGLP